MALYLIRHPQPLVAPGICYGQLDLPLAAPAVVSAELRAQLPERFICHSSPLQRCRLLAQALQVDALLDPRLMELNFGRWEGQLWDDIGAAALDNWIASNYASDAHGGESQLALQQRTCAWADEAANAATPAVAVTHAGVIRSLLAVANGWSINHAFNHALPFGSVTRLEW